MGSSTTLGQGDSDKVSPRKAVLIVNSDYKEGGAIRNSVEACGYEVSCWIDVADARAHLKARDFEVVAFSTNLGEKGMTGLLEELHQKRIPPKVILIADEDEGDASARCFLHTVVMVNRPFKIGEVADIVEHLIGVP